MKKIYTLFLALILVGTAANAQVDTAMDFIKTDCNGKMHHLFSELDSGNAIIMEFFHTCISCVNAAKDMKPMYQRLTAKYGNKVRFYGAPVDDDYPAYSCTYVHNWINNNGFTSMIVPFDSGSVQTAYYGGSAMPTIAVAAGSAHKLLYLDTPAGFMSSDTAIIETAIRHFLDSTFAGVPDISSNVSASVFPNPFSNNFVLRIETKEPGMLNLELTSITGQRIMELGEEKIQAGTWSKNFPVSLSNGVYFIKGRFNGKQFQEKVTVLH